MNEYFGGLCIALVLAAAVSCSAPKHISYFQDVEGNESIDVQQPRIVTVQPGDKISIIVNCREPQLASMFNLSYATRYVGAVANEALASASQSAGVQGYQVDEEGFVDFPILGKINVSGKSRYEISEYIKDLLLEKELLKEAVVTVEFLNLRVSVLGEVNHPGRFGIDKDYYTVLDAIGAAGDLTIQGRRECVKVLRTEGGVQKTYSINLNSARDVLCSEAYYLEQNDIVYVEPNKMRARQSTVNGNNVLNASFWMSAVSFVMTLVYNSLVIKAMR